MSQHLSIIPATGKQIPLIRELALKVWPQTYKNILSEDQVSYMLEMMYSEGSLKKQIEEGSMFIILREGADPIGFASFEAITPEKYKLHKIYILPASQAKGAGKFLIDHIMREIKKAGGSSLHLQVNKNNKAKQFYERLGFKEVDQIKLDIGNGYFMDDYIMEKQIL